MTAGKFWLTAALLLLALPTDAGLAGRVAIIIDDLGHQLRAGRRAIALPGDVAFAFLPGTPQAASLARRAFRDGKDILLHLPLQAESEANSPDPVGITLDMSRIEVGAVFEEALRSVPHVIGVNSHRGSLLTQHPGHMQWLMEEIHARDGLFFVDSYTTHKSVALQIAAETNVSAIKRDVFLDPDRSSETVAREFARMKALALRRGTVVAIGHPHEATLALLEKELPLLAEQGIELVRISHVVPGRAARSQKDAEAVELPVLLPL